MVNPEFCYSTPLLGFTTFDINPVLEGWDCEEKTIRVIQRPNCKFPIDHPGWLLRAPKDALSIQIDPNTREVEFYNATHSFTLLGLETVIAECDNQYKLLGFLGENVDYYLITMWKKLQMTVDDKTRNRPATIMWWEIDL